MSRAARVRAAAGLLAFCVLYFAAWLSRFAAAPPYRAAVAYIEKSAELRRVVGGDPVVGWFPRGGTKPERDSVRYVLRVRGPDASVMVQLRLRRVDRAWRVVGAAYRAGAGVAAGLPTEDVAVDLPTEDAEKLAAAHAHSVRGYALYQNGRLREALEEFDQAVALDPANELTLHWRAWVLHDLGDLRRAADDAARAVALDSLYGDAHHALGVMLGRLGDYEASARHFDRAIALLDDPSRSYYGRGVAGSAKSSAGRRCTWPPPSAMRPPCVRCSPSAPIPKCAASTTARRSTSQPSEGASRPSASCWRRARTFTPATRSRASRHCTSPPSTGTRRSWSCSSRAAPT